MKSAPSWLATRLADVARLPDPIARAGIRRLLRATRHDVEARRGRDTAGHEQFAADRQAAAAAMDARPAPDAEWPDPPAAFYRLVLGHQMKYSCASWDASTRTLDDAQARMLAAMAEGADLADGQRVLDLGCGWGSAALWIARAYPRSVVVAASPLAAHAAWIADVARRDRLTNVRAITADARALDAPAGAFDRIVSIEMFEQVDDWRALLSAIGRWLGRDGRAFVQMMTRRGDPRGTGTRADADAVPDWLARRLLAGVVIPRDDVFDAYGDLVDVCARWRLSGAQYRRTLDAWIANMDAHRAEIARVVADAYGCRLADARRLSRRWRVFFMVCAELWGEDDGDTWGVSQYVLRKAEN